MKTTKRGAGSKLNRTEIVQVRFDPRLRFALELMSRNEHRTVSSMIEKIVDNAVKEYEIKRYAIDAIEDKELSDKEMYKTVPLTEALSHSWHINEMHRFVTMALLMPQLLTYEEELIWNFIKSASYYWRFYKNKAYDEDGNFLCYGLTFLFEPQGVIWEHIEEDWPLLKEGDIEAVQERHRGNAKYQEAGEIVPKPSGANDEVTYVKTPVPPYLKQVPRDKKRR